jgi:hypothetical protein
MTDNINDPVAPPNSSASPPGLQEITVENELQSMADVAKALDRIKGSPDVIGRVLRWISERYGPVRAGGQRPRPTTTAEPAGSSAAAEKSFSDFASLFAAADPGTDPERALVGAYWQQVCQGVAEWDSFSINKQLKHLGHGVGNITLALGSLIERRPQLVIQTRKSGKERQARKLYKLTAEGIKRVDEMLSGVSGNGAAAS